MSWASLSQHRLLLSCRYWSFTDAEIPLFLRQTRFVYHNLYDGRFYSRKCNEPIQFRAMHVKKFIVLYRNNTPSSCCRCAPEITTLPVHVSIEKSEFIIFRELEIPMTANELNYTVNSSRQEKNSLLRFKKVDTAVNLKIISTYNEYRRKRVAFTDREPAVELPRFNWQKVILLGMRFHGDFPFSTEHNSFDALLEFCHLKLNY